MAKAARQALYDNGQLTEDDKRRVGPYAGIGPKDAPAVILLHGFGGSVRLPAYTVGDVTATLCSDTPERGKVFLGCKRNGSSALALPH